MRSFLRERPKANSHCVPPRPFTSVVSTFWCRWFPRAARQGRLKAVKRSGSHRSTLNAKYPVQYVENFSKLGFSHFKIRDRIQVRAWALYVCGQISFWYSWDLWSYHLQPHRISLTLLSFLLDSFLSVDKLQTPWHRNNIVLAIAANRRVNRPLQSVSQYRGTPGRKSNAIWEEGGFGKNKLGEGAGVVRTPTSTPSLTAFDASATRLSVDCRHPVVRDFYFVPWYSLRV